MNSPIGQSFDRRGSIPIGLAYIMSYLRSEGIESDGYDLSNSGKSAEELVDEYRLASYDVVGFSVYNESFFPTVGLANEIKRRNPDSFLLCGGPQATATHDAIIEGFDGIDAVIRREGEHPTLRLIQELRGGRGLEAVPNLTYRSGSQVVANAEMPAIENLDTLPFPDAEFVSEQPYPELTYYDERRQLLVPAITVGTSRSCPYNCSFCGVLTIGRRYRSRSPENVVEEVEYFRKKHGVEYRHVYFSDANFFVRGQRALEIVEALHDYDPGISFSFGTRVNQLLRAEQIIEKMIPLGLRFVEVGVESASPPVLERLSKGVSPETNVAATRMLQRLGVEIALDFIMIDPATTLEDLELNMAFIKDCGFADYYPVDHLYTSLGLYEGTPIREFYEDRLGTTFGLGTLPDIGPLIEHAETLAFWETTQSFRRTYQDELDRLLADTEFLLLDESVKRVLIEKDSPDFESVRQLQLDSVALRHAPLRFFDAVIGDIRNGLDPRCCDDVTGLYYGSPPVSLSELMARTRSLVDELRSSRSAALPHS
ncbi:B12-binding domain-containing radical SAM protein [Saccharomonospora saliphila]|uniref:B12-binding domain-containing radical SAM protein n=1 Tax=Saccharomonospora saliphila TaxID=369829 RepID=UPI0012FC99A0|nr:radical SAM protein [Saccharomonospora saliphila]